jgi:iron complex transport system ATP-binding protein
MESVLTLKKVGYRYGQIQAIKGIDLQVCGGEILGILGPNGSGKSTLLKVMDGILVPQEGEILIEDTPFAGLGRSHLAREVAMVAQETHFRFSFSTLEVVLMGRFPHLKRLQFEGKRDMEVATGALKATHTLEFAERSIHELSGGEKQRVLIARALAQEPRVVLLDEPTSFLDLKFKREIFQLISTLSLEKGLSVVVVSHDIDLTSQYCRRVIMLRNGSIYEMGEPEEVITAANIEAVYDCPVLVDKNPATGRPRVSLPP